MKKRQEKALNKAIAIIKSSKIAPSVKKVYLYGSCARNEDQWDSDVDLFIEFQDSFNLSDCKEQALRLKSDVNDGEIDEPEIDIHFTVGSEWESSQLDYYKNIRKDGVNVWETRVQISQKAIIILLQN